MGQNVDMAFLQVTVGEPPVALSRALCEIKQLCSVARQSDSLSHETSLCSARGISIGLCYVEGE